MSTACLKLWLVRRTWSHELLPMAPSAQQWYGEPTQQPPINIQAVQERSFRCTQNEECLLWMTINQRQEQVYNWLVDGYGDGDITCRPKQLMIERNPTDTMNNILFKINLPKKYALWCLHFKTRKTHTWKTNCTLFARLYIACQARQDNIETFFEHENQSLPPSISEMGQLWQGLMSDVLDWITKDSPPVQHVPDVGAKILDGAAIIHKLKPRGSRTIQDYAQQIFILQLHSQLESVIRINIVWDRHLQDSLKQLTREHKMNSNTSQQRVLDNVPIPPISSWRGDYE